MGWFPNQDRTPVDALLLNPGSIRLRVRMLGLPHAKEIVMRLSEGWEVIVTGMKSKIVINRRLSTNDSEKPQAPLKSHIAT